MGVLRGVQMEVLMVCRAVQVDGSLACQHHLVVPFVVVERHLGEESTDP